MPVLGFRVRPCGGVTVRNHLTLTLEVARPCGSHGGSEIGTCVPTSLGYGMAFGANLNYSSSPLNSLSLFFWREMFDTWCQLIGQYWAPPILCYDQSDWVKLKVTDTSSIFY